MTVDLALVRGKVIIVKPEAVEFTKEQCRKEYELTLKEPMPEGYYERHWPDHLTWVWNELKYCLSLHIESAAGQRLWTYTKAPRRIKTLV